MTDYDTFNDIRHGNAFGIFQGSEGLERHERVESNVSVKGLVLQFECQGCGTSTQMLVEYPELVAMKYGVNPAIAFRATPGLLMEPTRWEYRPHEDAWRPEAKCVSCGFNIPLRIARRECERHLATARGRNFINPQVEAQVSQICVVASQRGGQAVRR